MAFLISFFQQVIISFTLNQKNVLLQRALERDMGILFNGKFGLRLDTCSSTDNTLNDRGRLLEKSGVLLQI